MTLLADKDERFKNLFVKIAIFVLLALLGLAVALIWSSVKKGILTPKSSVYFLADSGQGIKKGMPVRLRGFKIGAVRDLSMDKAGDVQVEMRIDDEYMGLLREDAVVSLVKEGLIGDAVLDISSGTAGKKVLKAEDTILFERGSGMEQLAEDVRARLLPALDEVQKLLQDVNDPQGDVRQTIKNLHEFSGRLADTGARLDQLLDHVDEATTHSLQPLLQSVLKSAQNTQNITEKMNKDLPGMMNKLDDSLENLRQTSITVKSAAEGSAKELPGLLGDSRQLIGGTRDIVDAATTSWPLKTIMPQPEKGLIKMDSHD